MKTILVRTAGRFGILVMLLALVSACASLPTDFEKTPSYAIRDTGDTYLAGRVGPLVAAHPDQSGFYPMPQGIEALAARLRLARLAEKGIDLQYFIIADDLVGDLLLQELIDAANRGVRVRILMDDIYTEGYELAFSVLLSNPNIEIRLTNPFVYRDSKVANVMDLKRVNHRMHNKSITFDNLVSIVGGRNIAVDYFGASEHFNYYDFDVFAIGSVVDEVSTQFDTYWNAAESYPASAFVEPDDSSEDAQELADRFRASREYAATTEFVSSLDNEVVDFVLGQDTEQLSWADARLVYDLPYGEVAADGLPGEQVLGDILVEAVKGAASEFVLVSPYFVPRQSGLDGLQALRDRGVRCIVLTNSLASTDQIAVYGGYRDYQIPMLEMGVEVWELMAWPATPLDQPGAPTERRALHAKIYALDRERLFVGSFNWDPRSHEINTEMGVVIYDHDITTTEVERILATLPGAAWKLRLNDQGEVEWLDVSGDEEIVYDVEPQTDDSMRRKASLTDIKVLEDQL
jgi:putative cardiolipin synthase